MVHILEILQYFNVTCLELFRGTEFLLLVRFFVNVTEDCSPEQLDWFNNIWGFIPLCYLRIFSRFAAGFDAGKKDDDGGRL
ncbi:hypothetical protein AB6896_00490 [Rahnella inusitata]|uniref:hypothetical protein n=1 Tax=Rahnella inusitata TaxID=58169 RepID=UPI0039BECB5A